MRLDDTESCDNVSIVNEPLEADENNYADADHVSNNELDDEPDAASVSLFGKEYRIYFANK